MSRVSLSRFLSVGAGGEADAEIITDASRLRLHGGEIILGRGTNVLASDHFLQKFSTLYTKS